MPARKSPYAKAVATGAALRHPERYHPPAAIHQPTSPLGGPSYWLTAQQRAAWQEITDTMPWLEAPHRAIVEIAAVLLARLMSTPDTVSVKALNLLRLVIGQLCATPTDEHKL